jgi:hypothetical protein
MCKETMLHVEVCSVIVRTQTTQVFFSYVEYPLRTYVHLYALRTYVHLYALRAYVHLYALRTYVHLYADYECLYSTLKSAQSLFSSQQQVHQHCDWGPPHLHTLSLKPASVT